MFYVGIIAIIFLSILFLCIKHSKYAMLTFIVMLLFHRIKVSLSSFMLKFGNFGSANRDLHNCM